MKMWRWAVESIVCAPCAVVTAALCTVVTAALCACTQEAVRYLLPTRLSARDARPFLKVELRLSEYCHNTHHCVCSLPFSTPPLCSPKGKVSSRGHSPLL